MITTPLDYKQVQMLGQMPIWINSQDIHNILYNY